MSSYARQYVEWFGPDDSTTGESHWKGKISDLKLPEADLLGNRTADTKPHNLNTWAKNAFGSVGINISSYDTPAFNEGTLIIVSFVAVVIMAIAMKATFLWGVLALILLIHTHHALISKH